MEYWILGKIGQLCKVLKILRGKYQLSLFITPKDFEILFEIFLICTRGCVDQQLSRGN